MRTFYAKFHSILSFLHLALRQLVRWIAHYDKPAHPVSSFTSNCYHFGSKFMLSIFTSLLSPFGTQTVDYTDILYTFNHKLPFYEDILCQISLHVTIFSIWHWDSWLDRWMIHILSDDQPQVSPVPSHTHLTCHLPFSLHCVSQAVLKLVPAENKAVSNLQIWWCANTFSTT